ncbi:SPFH domain-containing protein [Stackebrandtia soli]|uniref:SPFH domain-containing protein n=1 Tax=Stackebrandtia soli TaxID=1892856 RepID=UPI0039E9C87A
MDKPAPKFSGFVGIALFAIYVLAAFVAIVLIPEDVREIVIVGASVFAALLVIPLSGLVVVDPNEAKVVQFFGNYVGTIDQPGFWCTWPLTAKRTVSRRVRNFETAAAKVNDADGNPVEIAAVIVWRVRDAARAVFSVDSYMSYVSIQAESALRHLATCYPYDSHGSDRMSLRDGSQVAEELTQELRERAAEAGIDIIETRITHLAYAPEIAQAMLRRQQASAVVAARQQIVEGAVSMVHLALEKIEEEHMVVLDEERRAAMVSNLLVVLCSDHATQPVVNAGSLYS